MILDELGGELCGLLVFGILGLFVQTSGQAGVCVEIDDYVCCELYSP